MNKVYCPMCDKNIIPEDFTYLDYDLEIDDRKFHHALRVRCDFCSHDFSLYMNSNISDILTTSEIEGEGMLLDRAGNE